MSKDSKKNKSIKVLGIGLIQTSLENPKENFRVIFKKGIGKAMISKILNSFEKEIIENEQGRSFIPLENFTAFINFYRSGNEKAQVIIYIDDKENPHTFPQLYLHSKKIIAACKSESDNEKMLEICENLVEIPRVSNVFGVFFVDNGGSPMFTKIMGKRADIIKSEEQVGGFISALFSFSKIILKDANEGELKEISFGNQTFHTIAKEKIIFAFLTDEMTPLLERYMHILSEEFFERYEDKIENFKCDISEFYEFEETLNKYLEI
ncbi:MAG: hypothetical protein GF317_05435 [Candidatus Lokiarchaeota archaeon]|nr:hypothetical protein [Candidatus Lokiarchaeota archaeon]MBD3199250.1 hypothetical protein [Candidatus Lokiarchaeota archaeon]